jgi:hypothetical protein
MANTTKDLPRPRGRPKADDTLLIESALLRWLGTGRDHHGLAWAIAETARHPPDDETCRNRDPVRLRRRLNRALRGLDSATLWQRAMMAARGPDIFDRVDVLAAALTPLTKRALAHCLAYGAPAAIARHLAPPLWSAEGIVPLSEYLVLWSAARR